MNDSTNQSMNDSTNQSINESANKSTNESTNISISTLAKQRIRQSITETNWNNHSTQTYPRVRDACVLYLEYDAHARDAARQASGVQRRQPGDGVKQSLGAVGRQEAHQVNVTVGTRAENNNNWPLHTCNLVQPAIANRPPACVCVPPRYDVDTSIGAMYNAVYASDVLRTGTEAALSILTSV